MDELVKCKAIVEGVDWVKDVFVAFRSDVFGPCRVFVDFIVFVLPPLCFCFAFLEVLAVDVFDDCAFFFFFTALPESGAVEVFFLVAFFYV